MANPPVPRHDSLPEDASLAKWIEDSERFFKAINGDIVTVTKIIVTAETPLSLTIINNIKADLEAGGRAPLSLTGLPGIPASISALIGDAENFSTTIIFSATDNNTVEWTAGTITFVGGSVFSISAGNTGNMSATTYIYFDSTLSSITLQTSTNPDDASGSGRRYMASADPIADATQKAMFVPIVGVLGINETVIGDNSISTPLLQADAVTANEILANTITGTEITGTILSGIFANLGTIVSGSMTSVTITGGIIRTAASGERVEMVDSTPTRVAWANTSGVIKYIETFETQSNTMSLIHGDGTSTEGIRISVLIGGSGGSDFLFTSTGLDCLTNSIRNCGNMELDSLTKDGAGNIAVNDIFDMLGNSIINIGQVECDSLAKDGGGNILVTSGMEMFGASFVTEEIAPDGNNTRSLGQTGTRYANGYFVNVHVSSLTNFNGVSYAWPGSDGSGGQQLQTDGAATLTWAAASSLRETKRYLKRRKDSFAVLERLCAAPVYNFKYKKGQGTKTDDWYTSVMAEDLPEVMHHGGKIFSPVSGFGYLLLGMQELNKRIAKLEG